MFNEKELFNRNKLIKKLSTRYLEKFTYEFATPFTISFLITRQCNLKCKHCFNHKTDNQIKEDKEALNLDEYSKLAENLGFFPSALFCGGEPFVRNDFAEIVKIFRDKCNLQWASTTTNGQNAQSIVEQTEKICKYSNGRRFVLNFSLDGFEEQHDYVRGIGTYKKCIDTIKQVSKLKKTFQNLQIGIVPTMTTINEDSLADFINFISDEINPEVISLLLVRQMPRVGKQIKEIKKENYIKAKEVLFDLFTKNKNGKINSPTAYYPFTFYEIIAKTLENGHRNFYCHAGVHSAYIDYNGDVNACEVLGDITCSDSNTIMGNLRDYNMNFYLLWNSMEAMEIRKKINNCSCCKNCTHETEGILPSIYFEPNSVLHQKEMKKNVTKISKTII